MRPGSTTRSITIAACFAVSLVGFVLTSPPAPAAPPSDENHIVLRSGNVLHGRVVDELKTEVGRMLKIETDFGVIHVPKRSVKKFGGRRM